jgi:Predicted transcriptional regulators
MLTLQLRKLEENNLVKRAVYAEVPPRVEYELTLIGYELKAIISELEKWGKKHKAIKAVRVHGTEKRTNRRSGVHSSPNP